MVLGDLLSPKEETDQRLFSFNLGILYKCLLIFTFSCFVVGLGYSTRTLVVGKENYVQRVPGFMAERKKLGFVGKITFHEVTESINISHPLFKLETRPWPWISYDFGSTISNYCFRKPYPVGRILPSFLRLLEFHAISQFLTRAAILFSLCIRLFLTTIAVNYLYQLLDASNSIRIARFVLPLLDIAWMTLAMLITAIHQDQDANMKWFMTYHLPGFAISFIMYAAVYTLLCAAALRDAKLNQMRMLCIVVFAGSFPQVYAEYLKFLELGNKVCYAEVPSNIAVMEYCAIAAVVLFTVSQFAELHSVTAVISISQSHFNESITETETFSPAYLTSPKTEGYRKVVTPVTVLSIVVP